MKSTRTSFITGASLALCAFFVFNSSSVDASTLSALGGLSLGTGPSPNFNKAPSLLVGGDYTFGATEHLELGVFVDQNAIDYKDDSTGSLRFYGAIARFNIGGTGLFADGRVGMSQRSADMYQSRLGAGVGAGLGYRLPVSEMVSLSPHMGFRYFANHVTQGGDSPGSMNDSSFTQHPVDFSFMVSIKF